jgi:adenine-specific DNA glycosylase
VTPGICPQARRPGARAHGLPLETALSTPADELLDFGLPLMPVDRHVERVAQRVGLIGRKVCHAQRPECARCPIRPRCRYVDPKAP